VCRNGVDYALRELKVTREVAVTQNRLDEVRRCAISYVNNRAERQFQSKLDHIIDRILLLAVGHHLAAGGTQETAKRLKVISLHGDYVDRGGLKCGVLSFPSAQFKQALARISSEVCCDRMLQHRLTACTQSCSTQTHTNTHTHTHTHAGLHHHRVSDLVNLPEVRVLPVCSPGVSSLPPTLAHFLSQLLSPHRRCDWICTRPVKSNGRYRHFCPDCFDPKENSDERGHSKDNTGAERVCDTIG